MCYFNFKFIQMKKISKLSLNKSSILTEKEMKNVQGKGYGLCEIYCGGSGTIYTIPYGSCDEGLSLCGPEDYGYSCKGCV